MSSASATSMVSVILQELYETEPKARRIVDIAGLNPSNIRFGGSAAETWHAVLGEAHKQGRLQALIDAALVEYPQRDDLRVAWATLFRALERQPFGLVAPGQSGPAEPDRPGSLDLHQPTLGKAHLRQAIVASFNLDELGVLCADLEGEFRSAGLDISLNLDLIGGSNSSIEARVQMLIDYLDRRNLLPYLIAAVRQVRPGRL